MEVPGYGEEAIEGAQPIFYRNITVSGGPAPVRAHVDGLLPDMTEGRIQPGGVFDRNVGLEELPDGYRAMDARESVKVMGDPIVRLAARGGCRLTS